MVVALFEVGVSLESVLVELEEDAGLVDGQLVIAQGAFDGADRWNHDFGLWSPPLRSADADLFPDKGTLDGRARDVLRNDAYVQGGATLHKDNIVGAHFLLNARPNFRVLFGKDDEQ